MIIRQLLPYVALVLALFTFSKVQAQAGKTKTRVLFIYDGSKSMNGKWESGTKHDVARKLLNQTMDSLQHVPNLEMALRVYGHQSWYTKGQDCNDTKLEVPFGGNNALKIKEAMVNVSPKGTTPIAMTLEKAGEDFSACDNCRNIIILITDGIEECNGDPCAVSRALQKRGIILKPFVIGVGLDESFIKTFQCVGNYFDASNEQVFQNVLNIVISQALNNTTAQLNLLDVNNKAVETNVPYTFYNQTFGDAEVNYVHTMNSFGVPDTIYLDPSTTYDLSVYTIPMVTKENVKLTPGTHNIIGVSTPQGQLQLKANSKIKNQQPMAIVRQGGKMQTLNAQQLGTTERYLVGTYDLEILTLPRTYINDVEITQSTTTKIELPPPGIATIMRNQTGYGAIFQYDGDKLVWVANLNENARNESFKLQPGRYLVTLRPKSSDSSKFTREKEFTITPGASVPIKLF
jgi:Ca-activated chloride channel family protein